MWRYRHLVLGAVGIFLAVGAEVAIGSFLVNYLIQPDIGGLTPKAGGNVGDTLLVRSNGGTLRRLVGDAETAGSLSAGSVFA